MKTVDIIASDKPSGAAWPLYRALVGVGIVCALLIVGVFLYTLPHIERNRAELLDKAILRIFPHATQVRQFALEQAVYAAFDAAGELLGVALQTQAMGYQDTVQILYGYDPNRQAIVGMQVLESRETPGLGDKIEHDPRFLQNFANLEVQLADDGQSLAHPIELVKPGQKTQPWQIDGISGATISSAAVARMLRRSSDHWIPMLYNMRAQFRPQVEAADGN